jgi:hypothetical protein
MPFVFRELNIDAELPLTRFLSHQQLLFVGLDLDHISLPKLKPSIGTIDLLILMGKYLAILLQKKTPMIKN